MNTLLRSVFVVVLFCAVVFSNGFKIDYVDAPWNEAGKKKFNVLNTTNSSWNLEGVRFSISNIALPEISIHYPLDLLKNVNGNDSITNFEFRINNDSILINPGASKTFSLTNTSSTSSTEWTPKNPQFLLKTGSISNIEKIKTIPGITLAQLDSISKTIDFYNENLFVLDTLGINSPNWSAGFFDTWYDYKNDQPIWQIQVAIPSDTFAMWGEAKKFAPNRMDERDLIYGSGPLFLMATALAQEYLNVDMQFLLATSFQESNAGLVKYIYTQDWEPDQGSIIKEVDKGVNYYNHSTNGDMMRGPMHFIESSYKDYVYDKHNIFFPYDLSYESSSKYLTTPQTGGCELNSPQIINAYFLSSVYALYIWQSILEQLDGKALNLFTTSNNKELASQLISWAWNKGLNSTLTYCNNPDPNKNFINDIDYVGKVWIGVNELENASKNSTTNNGTEEIYDAEITLVELERLLFGEGGNPSIGTLGTAGILHHFYHSPTHRAMLWNEVVQAYNLLKGNAPSTLGKDAISYRYDYLAILRIVKKHLNLYTLIPNETKGYTKIENNFPLIIKKNIQIDTNDSITINFTIKDDSYIDLNFVHLSSWTLDSNWGLWHTATLSSGDSLNANYQIKLDKEFVSYYTDIDKVKSVPLWIKATDRNYNSTIDTVTLQFDPVSAEEIVINKSATKSIIVNGIRIPVPESIFKNSDTKLEIYSLDGKKLHKSKIDLDNRNVTIHSQNLSNGLYLLKVSAKGYSKSIKFQLLR